MSLQNVVCGMVMILIISLLSEKECAFNVTNRAAAEHVVGSYEFPWFCIVALLDDMLCLCTIIHLKYVILSVDSLNRPRPSTTQQYYEAPWDLTVYAGTESNRKLHFIFFSSHFYQSRSGEHLYVGNVTPPSTRIIENAVKDPKTLKDFVFDPYGIALNTGLLQIKGTFYWSALVLPAPLFDWALNEVQMAQQINVYRINIESRAMDQTPWVLASWQPTTKSLLLTEAIYIPQKQCEIAYCASDEKACSKFPKLRYHMCFKALTFMDMCPIDRGAALYCHSFGKRVLGILTTALNCGRRNLPSVYTSIEFVHRLYKAATGRSLENGPRKEDFTTPRP